jgi:hypothetical protein
MFLEGYMAAPPTILVWAKVLGAIAIAAKASAVIISFFMFVFDNVICWRYVGSKKADLKLL